MNRTLPADTTCRRADRFIAPIIFLGAIAISAAASAAMPGGLDPAGVATALFVLAAMLAVLSWVRRENAKADRVTYWDIAGALTLVGVCVAALVDPATFAGVAEQSPRRN